MVAAPISIVGESLVPGVVPVLRQLGLEARVAAIGMHKPGVSFTMPGKERVDFNFKQRLALRAPGVRLQRAAPRVRRPAR